ncbi:MAG: hypothetical protein JOZ69_18815, partial [Myxococcales bacterium]|nr:hypothetical protein [Myxococcales bacterium]
LGVLLREMLTGEKPSAQASARLRPSDAHRELGPRHDALVACLTAVDPRSRPADATEARAELSALPWPLTLDRPPTPAPAASASSPSAAPDAVPSDRAPSERIALAPDGASVVDVWTGRRVERLPLTERLLARARAFAAADHPALQTVCRVDRDANTVWLAAVDGATLDRPLEAGERAQLEEALAALHEAGVVHGRVDRAHVVSVAEGVVVLRFEPEHDPTGSADRDRLALARLGAPAQGSSTIG